MTVQRWLPGHGVAAEIPPLPRASALPEYRLRVTAAVVASAEAQLSAAEAAVLLYCAVLDGGSGVAITSRQLADDLRLHRNTTAHALRKLAAKGIVEIERSRRDGAPTLYFRPRGGTPTVPTDGGGGTPTVPRDGGGDGGGTPTVPRGDGGGGGGTPTVPRGDGGDGRGTPTVPPSYSGEIYSLIHSCTHKQTLTLLQAFRPRCQLDHTSAEIAVLSDAFIRQMVALHHSKGNRFTKDAHLQRYFQIWYTSTEASKRCPLPAGVPVPPVIARLRNPQTATVPASESRHPALVAQRERERERQTPQPDRAEQIRIQAQIEAGSRLWRPILDQLRAELPADDVDKWLRPLRAQVRDGRLIVLALNRYSRDTVNSRYLSRIEELAVGSGEVCAVVVRIEVGDREPWGRRNRA